MSYTTDKITACRRWQEVKDMQYPEDPAKGTWYFQTTKARAWDTESLVEAWKEFNKPGPPPTDYFYHKDEKYVNGIKHFQTNHYAFVYVTIAKPEDNSSITIGSVDLCKRDFPEKWKELISAAKQRVDMLNSLDIALGHDVIQCANCEGNAMADDYLCQECRNNANTE